MPTRFAGISTVALCCAFLLGCGGDDSAEADGTAPGSGEVRPCGEGAEFTEGPCAIDLPQGRTLESVRCGYLTVPENRKHPDRGTIELEVMVYLATGDNPKPDPVVFLSGGPGAPGLSSVSTWAPSLWAAANVDRDFVVFDQRGTGMSRPSLFCPERDEAYATLSAVTTDMSQFNGGVGEAMSRCYERLVGEGRDLAGYSSAASARDVCDLVSVLGYDQYNVYGVSYGTRLAQTIMRDVPEGLRSAILDGVVPVGPKVATNRRDLEIAVSTLFAQCAADSSCATAYPDLETAFYDLIASLNASPYAVQWTDAQTGVAHTVLVTGDRLLSAGIESEIRSPAMIPVLPLLIASTAAGNMALLEANTPPMVAPSTIAWGDAYSVRCRDDAYDYGLKSGAEDAEREEYRRAIAPSDGACNIWPLPAPNAIESEAVTSHVPTLLLSGQFDPVTRASGADAVAAHLSHSRSFVLPDLGHGIMRANSPDGVAGECARSLSHAFLDAPADALDASCIDAIPPMAFSLPAP